jgi:hypothetical protein
LEGLFSWRRIFASLIYLVGRNILGRVFVNDVARNSVPRNWCSVFAQKGTRMDNDTLDGIAQQKIAMVT